MYFNVGKQILLISKLEVLLEQFYPVSRVKILKQIFINDCLQQNINLLRIDN